MSLRWGLLSLFWWLVVGEKNLKWVLAFVSETARQLAVNKKGACFSTRLYLERVWGKGQFNRGFNVSFLKLIFSFIKYNSVISIISSVSLELPCDELEYLHSCIGLLT